jgi:hypothetical protein
VARRQVYDTGDEGCDEASVMEAVMMRQRSARGFNLTLTISVMTEAAVLRSRFQRKRLGTR